MSPAFIAPGPNGSNDVRQIQHALNNAGGSLLPRLVEDGILGSKTKARVVEFQRVIRLKPDGIVGPKTRAALGLTAATDAAPPPLPAPGGSTVNSARRTSECDGASSWRVAHEQGGIGLRGHCDTSRSVSPRLHFIIVCFGRAGHRSCAKFCTTRNADWAGGWGDYIAVDRPIDVNGCGVDASCGDARRVDALRCAPRGLHARLGSERCEIHADQKSSNKCGGPERYCVGIQAGRITGMCASPRAPRAPRAPRRVKILKSAVSDLNRCLSHSMQSSMMQSSMMQSSIRSSPQPLPYIRAPHCSRLLTAVASAIANLCAGACRSLEAHAVPSALPSTGIVTVCKA